MPALLSYMNKLARYIIIAGVVALIGFLAWYFSGILVYILVAAVVSIIGKPLVNILSKVQVKRYKLPRWFCAGTVLIALWCVFLAVFFLLVPAVVSLTNQLANLNIQQAMQDTGSLLDNIQEWIIRHVPGVSPGFSLRESVVNELTSIFNNTTIINMFGSVTNTVVGFLWGAFAVSFIAFFFLKEDKLFEQTVVLLFPGRYEAGANEAMNAATNLLTRYFTGIFIEMFCLMFLVTLGLTLIAGLPFKVAIVLGMLSGILNIIPYIGSIASSLIGIAIGVLTGAEGAGTSVILSHTIVMALVYIGAQTIDVAVFQPIIYSKSVRSHPLEIFIVLLVAGSIGGMLAMLVAIPAYTVIRVFAKQFFSQFKIIQKLTKGI